MRNSTFFGANGLDRTKPVVDQFPVRTLLNFVRSKIKGSHLIDLTVVVGDEAFPVGDTELPEVEVPNNVPVEFHTEFELPTMDTDIHIEVINEISEDGGTTWLPFGSFVREPSPWLDTKCGIAMALADGNGQPVSPAEGSLQRSTVKLTKEVTGKVSYLFRPNKG